MKTMKMPVKLAGVDSIYTGQVAFILSKAKNLETLRYHHAPSLFPFLERVDGKLVPLSMFADSLKRTEISGGQLHQRDVSARNATFILVFGRQIEEAALDFGVDLDDVKCSEEFSSTFKGLATKLKQLALGPLFLSDPKKTRW